MSKHRLRALGLQIPHKGLPRQMHLDVSGYDVRCAPDTDATQGVCTRHKSFAHVTTRATHHRTRGKSGCHHVIVLKLGREKIVLG